MTGWPLYGLYWPNDDLPIHIVTKAPSGKFFDINGFSEGDWNNTKPRPITISQIKTLVRSGRYCAIYTNSAKRFARLALNTYQEAA